jgi:hypothetical protein
MPDIWEKLINKFSPSSIIKQGIISGEVSRLNLSEVIITSNPPSGHLKILNIYVDSNTNKVVVDYDNTPQ